MHRLFMRSNVGIFRWEEWGCCFCWKVGIKKLQAEYENLKRQINESSCSDYEAEEIRHGLKDFDRVLSI